MARAFVGAAEPLSKAGLMATVDDLGVDLPALVALLAVESSTCGFQPDRRPIILFERHLFHKFTGGRFSGSHPDISNPVSGGYAFGEKEYPRLDKAIKLDRQAALKSASWGAGQVLGMNAEACGWSDVESFVADMCESEDLQLQAVAGYLKSRRPQGALAAHDWAAVARGYNGANFAKFKYDIRLRGEFDRFSNAPLVPDLDVRAAQLYLSFLGERLGVDGLYGKFSRATVLKFKASAGLSGGERVDKALLDALRERVRALR